METALWLGAAVSAATLVGLLYRIGHRAGRIEERLDDLAGHCQHVPEIRANLREVEHDVAALAPAIATAQRIETQLISIADLITSHMSADGHVWTIKKVSSLETLVEQLHSQLDEIEKRKGRHDDHY